MHLLPREIAARIRQALDAAVATGDLPTFDAPPILVQPSTNPEFGDYTSPFAMQAAKAARRNPRQLAETLVRHIVPGDFLVGAEVAGPGFINVRLDDDWLRSQVDAIIAEGDALFTLDLGAGRRAQVEFVSANPTGPLHIGRSRGAIVGDATARILEAVGWVVQREYYFNNAGVQMRNLGESLRVRYLQALGRDMPLPDDERFYQGEYLVDFGQTLVAKVGDTWAERDWQPFKAYAEQRMFEVIRATLARVNIQHDVFFNENTLLESGETNAVVAHLKANNDLYHAAVWDGADDDERARFASAAPAWWFRSTRFGDDKDRVLLKGDGEATYTLPDIAYHMNKLARGFDMLINVLGADHATQYKVVQHGVSAMGGDANKIRVIIVQLVKLLRDGVEVKMSTRRGNYETLDDLIDATSADAVRYILLARSPDSHLNFDVAKAIERTNDNPVYYIQNAHVRCAGILREAAARGLSDDGDVDLSLLGASELVFLRKVMSLGDVLEVASGNLEAHRLAFYAHELAAIFHPLYETVRALHSDVPPATARARLRFYRAAQVALRRVLLLMGMTAPEVM